MHTTTPGPSKQEQLDHRHFARAGVFVATVATIVTAAFAVHGFLSKSIRTRQDGPQVAASAILLLLVLVSVLAGLWVQQATVLRRLHAREAHEQRRADVALFDLLTQDLDSRSPALQMLRRHSFDAPVQRVDIETLRRVMVVWDVADGEFHDRRVDAARRALLDSLSNALDVIDQHARLLPDGSVTFGNPLREPPDLLARRYERIEALARDVWTAHQRLVRTARGRLAG